MLTAYDREGVIRYASKWCFVKHPFYSDATKVFNNNASFAYQSLLAGGHFTDNESRYLDYSERNRIPVISKYSNFHKALSVEVGAAVVAQLTPLHAELRSGDFIAAHTGNTTLLYVVEHSDAIYYYSNSPYIRKGDIITGEHFTLYFMPEYLEI